MVFPPLRRGRLAVCVLASLVPAPLVPAARAEVVFSGVAAGDMSSTDAVLWTRADNGGNITSLTAQVATDPDFANIAATLNDTTSPDSDFTLKLQVGALSPHTRYFYRFRTSDGVTSPTGQFATAPAPQQRVGVRFAFSGDADGRFRPYPSIANLPAQKLDFFVFVGDAMYEIASAGSPAVPLITAETTGPAQLEEGLRAYNRKYLENMLGVDPATERPSASGQQSLQPMLAATGSYTLLDNHELGNRSLQSGGAPPSAPPQTTDPSFDVNSTGSYDNKTAAFRTLEKAFLDFHPTRSSISGNPGNGYRLSGPRVSAPADLRTDDTPQLYFAQQWGANCIYIQTDDRSYRDIRLAKLGNRGPIDDVGRAPTTQTGQCWVQRSCNG